MKLFHFETKEQHWDCYTEFSVLANYREQAWKMIQAKMNKLEDPSCSRTPIDSYEFIDDISKYEITEHELNKPIVISFFQAG